MRTVKHPVLLKDPDVLQFLESSDVSDRTAHFTVRTRTCLILTHWMAKISPVTSVLQQFL